MEDLQLVKEWTSNEEELRPLLEKILPLLRKREELENKLPGLRALRSKGELLPSEAGASSAPPPPPPAPSSSILLDTGEHLEGLPPRPVPDLEKFQKMVEKKKAQNRKKHLKEKERQKAGKLALEAEKMVTEGDS